MTDLFNQPAVELCDGVDKTTITIAFNPVHTRENNEASQAHLDKYRNLFNESCFSVLKALAEGHILNTDNAKELAGTRSLPRRIKDLKDNYGLSISESTTGACKNWFMTEADKVKALEILLSKKVA